MCVNEIKDSRELPGARRAQFRRNSPANLKGVPL
jgi:hypothetical protein